MPAYKRPPQSAFPYPRFGIGILPASPTNTDYVNILTNQLFRSVNGASFGLDDGGSNYMYFATPVENGTITFEDLGSRLRGGWDGAQWPTDGTEGSGNGPITVSLTFDGDTRDWYVYRTDFPGSGLKTYAIYFDTTPTSFEAGTPSIGFFDSNAALVNPIPIVVDGPSRTVKLGGGQYVAFEYNAKEGLRHLHHAIGTGNVTLRLYDKNRNAVLPVQDSNNGPNGNDEIDYEFNSIQRGMLLLVYSAESAGTETDITVNVTSDNASLTSNGHYDVYSAIGDPVSPIELGETTTITFNTFEENIAIPFVYDGANGGQYEISVIQPDTSGGVADVIYEVWNHDGSDNPQLLFGVDYESGPSGHDEDNVHTLVASSAPTKQNDAFLLVRPLMRDDTGAVHVVDAASFIIEQGLYPSDIKNGDVARRCSISSDGSVIVQGSIFSDPNEINNAGAAYVWIYNSGGGVYEEVQKIVHPNLDTEEQDLIGDRLGFQVKVSGNGQILLITINLDEVDGYFRAGSVLFYKRNGNQFDYLTKLTSPTPRDLGRFGFSLECSNDGQHIFIGTLNEKRVYRFDYDGNNTVSYVGEYRPTKVQSNGRYGRTVKLGVHPNGTDLALYVGDPNGDSRKGRVYVHPVRVGGSWVAPSTEESSFSFDENTSPANQYFGYSIDVAHDGSYVVVGSYGWGNNDGAIHEMTYNSGQGKWERTNLIFPNFGYSVYFGLNIVLDSQNDLLYANAYRETGDTGTNDQGSVIKFSRSGGTWSEIDKSRPPQTDWAGTYWGLEIEANANRSKLVVGSHVPKLVDLPLVLNVLVRKVVPEPRYGLGNLSPGFGSFSLVGGNILPNQFTEFSNGIEFTINPNNEFIYFAIPVTKGEVRFIDKSNGYEGGWDGAQWPNEDGGVGNTVGPVVVNMNYDNEGANDWYVYRTDFKLTGSKTFRVFFK